MRNDSTSGPDGFIVEFFESYWDLVEQDFLDAIGYFFPHTFIYYPINSIAISLVHKVDAPFMMKEFRPLSCSNVCYKVISHIITSIIKPFLSYLVGINQSAFVQGRSIQNNLILMHVLAKRYRTIRGANSCAIKVDVMKALIL